MAFSIKQNSRHVAAQQAIEAHKLQTAILNDLAALRGAVVGITAKLDAETVTGLDSDYASLLDPAALELGA